MAPGGVALGSRMDTGSETASRGGLVPGSHAERRTRGATLRGESGASWRQGRPGSDFVQRSR